MAIVVNLALAGYCTSIMVIGNDIVEEKSSGMEVLHFSVYAIVCIYRFLIVYFYARLYAMLLK